jgi:hypothetical protein
LLDLAFDRAFDLLAAQFARLAASMNGQGGFVGALVAAFLPGFAEGGMIRGPGGPTADRVPIMASNGEYMIKAASVTPQTLPFLEAINRGAAVPRYATGGQIGGGGASAGQSIIAPQVNVTVHNSSAAQVEVRQGPNKRDLEIFVIETVKGGLFGGQFDRALSLNHGLRRTPRGGS